MAVVWELGNSIINLIFKICFGSFINIELLIMLIFVFNRLLIHNIY